MIFVVALGYLFYKILEKNLYLDLSTVIFVLPTSFTGFSISKSC